MCVCIDNLADTLHSNGVIAREVCCGVRATSACPSYVGPPTTCGAPPVCWAREPRGPYFRSVVALGDTGENGFDSSCGYKRFPVGWGGQGWLNICLDISYQ